MENLDLRRQVEELQTQLLQRSSPMWEDQNELDLEYASIRKYHRRPSKDQILERRNSKRSSKRMRREPFDSGIQASQLIEYQTREKRSKEQMNRTKEFTHHSQQNHHTLHPMSSSQLLRHKRKHEKHRKPRGSSHSHLEETYLKRSNSSGQKLRKPKQRHQQTALARNSFRNEGYKRKRSSRMAQSKIKQMKDSFVGDNLRDRDQARGDKNNARSVVIGQKSGYMEPGHPDDHQQRNYYNTEKENFMSYKAPSGAGFHNSLSSLGAAARRRVKLLQKRNFEYSKEKMATRKMRGSLIIKTHESNDTREGRRSAGGVQHSTDDPHPDSVDKRYYAARSRESYRNERSGVRGSRIEPKKTICREFSNKTGQSALEVSKDFVAKDLSITATKRDSEASFERRRELGDVDTQKSINFDTKKSKRACEAEADSIDFRSKEREEEVMKKSRYHSKSPPKIKKVFREDPEFVDSEEARKSTRRLVDYLFDDFIEVLRDAENSSRPCTLLFEVKMGSKKLNREPVLYSLVQSYKK